MRLLEYVMVVVVAAYLVAPNLWWRAWIPVAGLAVGVAHLVLEGYRWQMVPLYLLMVVLVLLNARGLRGPGPRQGRWPDKPPTARRGWVVAGTVLGTLALVVAAAPPILFPVPLLPAPGGPQQIGTVTFQWTDAARLEAYTPAPDDARTIMVQLGYPAVPAAGAQTAPWMDRLDAVGPVIARYLNLPSFFLDHAGLLKTNDYAGVLADQASPTYPVVLYSHGWNGFRTINLNQSEALASHGYIAVAVDHTYGAMVTVFADGRVAPNNPAALPDADVVGEAEYTRATQQLEATFAADLSYTLDQLALINDGTIPSPLAGKLDLSRVGVYGHSTGGGATVVMCAADARCQAALGMDAWLGPVPDATLAAGLSQPFLAMRSAVWATESNDARLETLLAAGSGAGDDYVMTIAGTKHYDFTLLPLLTPLAPALGLKGPINGERGMQIITDYLVGFFDFYLKGVGSVAREGYPEVTFAER